MKTSESGVKVEFLEWLDTNVIADTIAEDLEEQGMEVTVINMGNVWLNFLINELPEGLRRVIAALKEKKDS
ncbi:unnamed protein product [marine sediment metagenome]|uniref:Uncharacterized protein n=1 Tax=marine sediment metagenome TaxID=412755 RepID=X1S3X3_9ZZZZ